MTTERGQNGPVMDGATEATDDEKRAGLRAQLDEDHPEGDGAAKAADSDKRHAESGLEH